MNAFDIEQLLLSHVLTFGNDAARICLPQLTPEKFVFNADGGFGLEHSLLWTQIRNTYMKDQLSPLASVIKKSSSNGTAETIDKLPLVTHLDPKFVEQLTNLVDKQGLVYNVSKFGHALGNNIASAEHFMQTLEGINDVEQWSTEQLTKLRTNTSIKSDGYEHVSVVADRVKQRWDDIFNGRVSHFVECGIDVLKTNYLFPAGELAIIHGLSGGGKSSFVFQVQLGTAIDLYLNDKPGCVAINSLEMTSESLVERLAGMLARVDLKKFKARQCSQAEYDRLLEWIWFVEKLPIFVDDTNFLTTTALQYRASGLHVSEHGPVVQLSSDYGELFSEDDKKLTKEQRINKVFREQFNLSRMIGASVIAISQSTVDPAVSGKSYIAGVDGLRYSKGALHAADIVAEMYNPVQAIKAGRDVVLGKSSLCKEHPYLLVQKGRYGEIGSNVPFGWIAEYTTFFDMSLPYPPGKEKLFTHLDDAVAKAKSGVKNAW